MRTIKLKKFKDENGNESNESYADVLVGLLSIPKNKEGADYEEMARVIPIIQYIHSVGKEGSLQLEEAQYKEVLERVERGPYRAITTQIYQMITDIKNAESVEIN